MHLRYKHHGKKRSDRVIFPSFRGLVVGAAMCGAAACGAGLLDMGVFALPAPKALAQSRPTTPSSDAVSVDDQIKQARVELAELFAQQALQVLNAGDLAPNIYQQGDALAQLAIELAPDEPRFHRIAVDAALSVGERARALHSLKRIRQLTPDDELTQVQLIDLIAAQTEKAEEKVAYLERVVAASSLPNVVRSHGAMLLYDAYAQRGQDAQADKAVAEALQFNPENLSALRIAYQRLGKDATAAQRAEKIAAMLRGNPTQTDAILALANLLADAGRHDKAQEFYILALSIGASKGVPAGLDDGLKLLSSQWIAGDIAQAASSAQQLAQMYPDEADLRLAQVLLAKKLASQVTPSTQPTSVDPAQQAQAQVAQLIDAARAQLVHNVVVLSRVIDNGGKALTPQQTPAVGTPLPDVAADVLKLQAPDLAHLKPAYANVLADLAFFDLYATEKQTDAAVMAGLATLAGEGSSLNARIVGWSHLLAGRASDAQVKFDAVADQDPLAALGQVLLLESTDKAKAVELARRLLESHRGGLLAAIISERVKHLGVSMQIHADADALVAATETPRQTISKFVNEPRSTYVMTAQPVKTVHDYGEPVLVDVTIRNSGNLPVTIGAGGMIDPRVFIDATIRGIDTRLLPQQQLVTLTGRIRLEPSRSFTQRVRVDGVAITSIFSSAPTVTIPVEFLLVSNGLPTERGTSPAAGGQSVTAGRIVERRASNFAVPQVRSELIRRATSGSAAQRIRLIDLFCRVSFLLGQQSGNVDAAQVKQALDAAIQDRQDADVVPEIRMFTKFSRVTNESDIALRKATLDELAKDPSPAIQMLACLMVATIDEPDRKPAFQKLAGELPDGPAKRFAQAAASAD